CPTSPGPARSVRRQLRTPDPRAIRKSCSTRKWRILLQWTSFRVNPRPPMQSPCFATTTRRSAHGTTRAPMHCGRMAAGPAARRWSSSPTASPTPPASSPNPANRVASNRLRDRATSKSRVRSPRPATTAACTASWATTPCAPPWSTAPAPNSAPGASPPRTSARSQLEAVTDLDHQLLAVAQREGIGQLLDLVAGELVVHVAAAAVDDVQVGQRGDLVAVTHLEAEVLQAEVVHRLVHRHRRADRARAPGLAQPRVHADRLQLHPQFLAVSHRPVEAGVDLHLLGGERADQVLALPDHPLGVMVEEERGEHAERVAEEVRRGELDVEARFAVVAEA